MPTGTIARLLIDKGFGFIRDESGIEHFFHRSSVRGAVFELLREGQRVEFTPEESGKGPRAGEVRLDRRLNTTARPAGRVRRPARHPSGSIPSPPRTRSAPYNSHGSERGPVAFPVFKTGRCPRYRGRAGFDSQALPPRPRRGAATGLEDRAVPPTPLTADDYAAIPDQLQERRACR